MAVKTQNGCRQCITVLLDIELQSWYSCQNVLWWIHRNQIYKFQVEWKPRWPPNSKMSAQNWLIYLITGFDVNTCISFSDAGIEVLLYILAIHTALKVTAIRFHFYLESKMAAKTQNGGCQCVELTIAPCEQSRENWMLVWEIVFCKILTSGFLQIYSTLVIVFQNCNLKILLQVFIWLSGFGPLRVTLLLFNTVFKMRYSLLLFV